MSTGISKMQTPRIVSKEVAAAEPNNCCCPNRSLKIIQDNDVALADALNPTIGSNTLKLSINCIKPTKVTSGAK